MSKKTKELIERYEELLADLREAQKGNYEYYLAANRRNLKMTNALNTAAARAKVSVVEDIHYSKYGPQVDGRRIKVDDLPAMIDAVIEILGELDEGKQVKRDWADTEKGDVTVARSAVGTYFEFHHGRGSKRDQAEKIAKYLSN